MSCELGDSVIVSLLRCCSPARSLLGRPLYYDLLYDLGEWMIETAALGLAGRATGIHVAFDSSGRLGSRVPRSVTPVRFAAIIEMSRQACSAWCASTSAERSVRCRARSKH